jgi:UDP-N-acetylglucosamine transferase subunit ALG13
LIFIITGTQKFQFNRLLKEIDILKRNNKISHEIFAQIGYSTYKPNTYNFVRFLEGKAFKKRLIKADLIITHGGSAAITTSLKNNKKVIAFPRLKEFGEHVDDHQLEVVSKLKQEGLIEMVLKLKDLEDLINNIEKVTFKRFKSNTELFIKSIENDINVF